MESFQTFVNLIGHEYRRLGHSLGWRFLCVSRDALKRGPRVVLLTLNPGGNTIPADHPCESCEEGSAYSVEKWGNSARGRHPLQIQVQSLFEHVAARVDGASRNDVSMDASLIGDFIPFRSPRLADLPSRADSVSFARSLWASVLAHRKPGLFITIDPMTFGCISDLCRARGGAEIRSIRYPTGWGAVSADVREFRFDDFSTCVLRLPHLSTFKLFSRVECSAPIATILDDACRFL